MDKYKGNVLFSSSYTLNYSAPSRRDDLISLVYLLVYIATGKIPFVDPYVCIEFQFKYIKYKRRKIIAADLCEMFELPYLEEFTDQIFFSKV